MTEPAGTFPDGLSHEAPLFFSVEASVPAGDLISINILLLIAPSNQINLKAGFNCVSKRQTKVLKQCQDCSHCPCLVHSNCIPLLFLSPRSLTPSLALFQSVPARQSEGGAVGLRPADLGAAVLLHRLLPVQRHRALVSFAASTNTRNCICTVQFSVFPTDALTLFRSKRRLTWESLFFTS